MMKRFILASLAVVLLLAGIGYLVYYRESMWISNRRYPSQPVSAPRKRDTVFGWGHMENHGDTGRGFILQHPR